MNNPIENIQTQSSPFLIEKDLASEPLAKKIWNVCALIFGISLVATSIAFPYIPLVLASIIITISALALSILLISECARRFAKEPKILGSLDYEIFSIIGAGMTYFKKEDDTPNGEEPILFIHGYLHNSSAWVLFKKRLKKQGIKNPLYTINLGSPFQSLEEYTKKVQEKIEKIKSENTHSKTIKLIGHSMGGVVSAYAADETVSEVITLGSPFAGTKLASLGIGPCAKQMRINSEFMAKLKNKMALPTKTNYVFFGSDADLIILPQSSANPDKKGYKFSHMGHLSFLYSEQVVTEVAKHLTLKAC